MKRVEQFFHLPLYPLFFSIYPVLELFSNNLYQMYAYTIIGPLIFSILLGLTSFRVINHLLGEWHLAAVASSALLLLFFSYGHVQDSMKLTGKSVLILLPFLWLILSFFTVFLLVRLRGRVNFAVCAPVLNLVAIILLLFPLEKFIYVGLLSTRPFKFQVDHFVDLSNVNLEKKPDIYYIIMDGYTRSDILLNDFNFNNSDFLNTLTDIGFKVVDCGQSNYPGTGMSLSSSMNMDYLQELNPVFLNKDVNYFYYAMAIKNSSVERSLKTAGYTTIAYATGFPWAVPDVDQFFDPQKKSLVSEFDVLFMRTTFFRLIDQFFFPLSSITDQRYRQRLKFALNSDDLLLSIPSPKFVFMHILSSHNPYVVDHNGNDLSSKYRSSNFGYVEQTQYSSREIVKFVRKIISASKIPPIIVIQGDHGIYLPDEDRITLQILNAYYLPENSNLIYSTITPVNTFRLIFNTYFKTDFKLLDDISYKIDKSHGGFTIPPVNCDETKAK